MATIYARGGCWYLNWSQAGRQQRKSLGAITPHQAEIHRNAKELELSTGKRIFIASALFDDHLERYLTWHATEFPDSHFRVRQIADQHFALFQGKALSQITRVDVDKWKMQRLETKIERKGASRPIARSTVAKEQRTLHAVFEKAVEWKEMEENPAEYTEAPKSLTDAPPHFYTRAQLAQLYKRPHGHEWRLVANAGLRRTEAQQLAWSRVDFRARHIDIVSSPHARTKSGKWRRIPMSAGAYTALRALKKVTGDQTYVIPRITAPSLSRAFIKDARRLKFEGSIHSLRHSYGSHMVMAGVPIRTVKELMGHASINTTMQYAHLAADHLRDQAKKVSL